MLRQGARNVAGVSWQIEVTAYLVVMGRIGALRFRHFTPEGIEDVDCRDTGGGVAYVQMKELAGGRGRMTASGVAEALFHGQKHTAESPVIVVTDAALGSGLNFTGWMLDMRTDGSAGCASVQEHLSAKGLSEDEAERLMGRSFLVSLPWDMRPLSEKLLVEALGTSPAVAALAVSRLIDLVSSAAADQRTATAQTARAITCNDLDTILAEIQSTVDTEGLDEAISAGVCSPANYLSSSNLTAGQFYLGAEGAPGLIAAGLDVVRPGEMKAILEGFSRHQYALLLGPSGAGKSVLLWRAARDVLVGASILRVVKVSTAEEVDLLVRHARLQQPSRTAPLVIAADNLGRPQVGAWPEAARRLREIPWVYLLGAARSEDFSPRLAAGGASVVELVLDAATANNVAEAVRDAGIEILMDPQEAQERAEGLLMEYMALLTAGQKFRQVLADQVEGLRDPQRKVERTLARLVTTAHGLGIGLEADALPRLLSEQEDIVGAALGRLSGEHVILRAETEWRGLHELRSSTISNLLHEAPPPTLERTLNQVAEVVPLPLAGWLLRRVAQETSGAVSSVADIIGVRLAEVDDAVILASALEGAERADSFLYAAKSLPVLKEHASSTLTVHQLAMLIYGIGNQGIGSDTSGGTDFDRMLLSLTPIAAQVGPRAAIVVDAISRQVTTPNVMRVMAEERPENISRLLEACIGILHFNEEDATALLSAVPTPTSPHEADIVARIIDSLVVLADLPNSRLSFCIGDLESRANMLTCTEPWALNIEVEHVSSEITLTATLMTPSSESERSLPLTWDIHREEPDDLVHSQAMRIAKRLADGCPEADMVKIVTLSPSGSRYVVAGHEPGYKTLKREVFKRRESVRQSVSYQASLRRLEAASSWTDLLREQVLIAAKLSELLGQGHQRMASTDNMSRRHDWEASLAEVNTAVKSLRNRPFSVAVDPGLSHAQSDQDERSEDAVTRAFEHVILALGELAERKFPVQVSMSLQKALASVDDALRAGTPTLSTVGSPLPDELRKHLDRLLQLQRALAAFPYLDKFIRTSPETMNNVIRQATQETATREASLLGEALHPQTGYQLFRITSEDPLPHTVDECDIVLVTELSALDAVHEALQKCKSSIREALTSRIYLVATLEEDVLPIAFQFAMHSPVDIVPLPAPKRSQICDAAGLIQPQRALTDGVTKFVEVLSGRSAAAALRHRRNVDWPAANAPEPLEPDKHLPAGLSGAHPVVDHLVELYRQVMAEEEGFRPPGELAGAMIHPLSGLDPDAEQSQLLNHVSMAVIESFR
ncbi:hypothetical protein [Arthrobacter sp. yr096]|uniref:hypothetical protein n=1 Tax=Arthrobacter sp. yr096 TaxID=1761750 RepID=UPI0015A4F359|nr:hypothetical protein [Arthrobacter sp. yr096]